MLYNLLGDGATEFLVFSGFLAAFFGTVLCLRFGQNLLPRDGGRKFAVNAQLAKGKPRGAGLLFISVLAITAVLFLPFQPELLIYILLTVAAMLSGYFDDASAVPWGEYKKGLIDFAIALVGAFTYVNFNGNEIALPFTDTVLTLSKPLFIILAVLLIWVAINVTNCSDGVDGLSGTLTILTLGAFLFLGFTDRGFALFVGMLIAVLLAYQWFNAPASILMMGDAGSRAMGIIIAFAALKSGNPLLYLAFSLVLLLNGGLSIAKISLKRFLKILILKNTRTPIHDHMRKNKNWTDTQVIFRFAIIQIIIIFATIYWIK